MEICDRRHIASQHHVVASPSTKPISQEVAMAALVKKTSSRVVRWVQQFVQKNKTPYRWYEVDHRGV
jgi:hypothetical protein